MWEYASMWHRANWVQKASEFPVVPGYTKPDMYQGATHWTADGWDGWQMAPPSASPPPPHASDADALNFMGAQGWEVVHVDSVLDWPATHRDLGEVRNRYLFKRPRQQ